MKTLLRFLSITALSVTASFAADKKNAAPAHTLSEFKIGAAITGPEVKLEEVSGKAVLIDAWGIHCGPCLASLPEIEKIAKRYKDKMVVIGAHSQQATDDEVKAVVKKNRLSYGIVNGVNSPVSFSGIPHVFVFDTSGSLVFEGHPGDKNFAMALQRAVRPPAGKP